MQKTFMIIVSLLGFLLLFNTNAIAADYTLDDIALHNKATDCWMIFSENVYDITDKITDHDRYMDIRDWCGRDMTEDFQTKAGEGKDHKPATYEMLKDYLIGKLIVVKPTLTIVANENFDNDEPTTAVVVARNNPYNFIVPFATTLILYLVTYLTATKGWFNNVLILPKVNLLWNTMLAILLIPSVVFGFIMVFQYPFPALAAIKFDFLYWHVEGSIAFGTLVLCHFLQRFRQYLVPLRLFNKASPVDEISNERS